MVRKTLLAALLLWTWSAAPARAQEPLVDGLTLGAGLSVYAGDLDGVAGFKPLLQLGAASLHALAGVDRGLGETARARLGLALNYHHLSAEGTTNRDFAYDVQVHLLALDAVVSYDVGIVQPNFLRVYAGVGPALVLPTYNEFPPEDEDPSGTRYDPRGTRLRITTPVGIILQDRVRLAVRIPWTDYLDGFSYEGSDPDLLGIINIGYRFELGGE